MGGYVSKLNPERIEELRRWHEVVSAQLTGGVARCVRCIESDVFEAVDGTFDVIVIDPPFRWFAPKDPLERAITDENYEALGRFFADAGRRLRPDGYVLLFFGTSGDVDHLDDLVTTAGMDSQVVARAHHPHQRPRRDVLRQANHEAMTPIRCPPACE